MPSPIDTRKIDVVGKVLIAASWLDLMNIAPDSYRSVSYFIAAFGACVFFLGKILSYTHPTNYAPNPVAKTWEQTGAALILFAPAFISKPAFETLRENPELPTVLALFALGLLTMLTARLTAKYQQQKATLPPPPYQHLLAPAA